MQNNKSIEWLLRTVIYVNNPAQLPFLSTQDVWLSLVFSTLTAIFNHDSYD